MKAVFDTNIVIDYLNGVPQSADVIAAFQPAIVSRVTWIEVLAGVFRSPQERVVRAFLDSFQVAEITPEVAEAAIRLRVERRLRLPDALILATAHAEGCLLLTRDTRDFSPAWPEIREPYRL